MKRIFYSALLLGLCLNAYAQGWNNPHIPTKNHNVRYDSFSESPKTLDPARAYSANESQFISQIYEPPLQYHYLKRPFTLVPLTLTDMPVISYYDKQGKKLANANHPDKVAYTLYNITIMPGIFYQPHPALAKNKDGRYRYHHLTSAQLDKIYILNDFKHHGTRELTADDYVYQIKRIANPKLSSPILGLMSKHIIGLKEYSHLLKKEFPNIDLRKHPIEGVKVINRYQYQIKIKGVYPQFKYWLAMPFFSPIPWEADIFYNQKGLKEKNITLDWYPIGTGPYMLSENNPNKQMVLTRNPHFHGETYPQQGEPNDKAKGYLQNAGKQMPFIDKFVFSLDKENIPRWNKFLQGYYDRSGIAADSFDQAIELDKNGNPILTENLKKNHIQLRTTVEPAAFYLGFNMLDNVVGGNSVRAKKLRQAISIAVDYEEYIAIFMNGRGIASHGPIPPGLFGYVDGKDGINHVVYEWDGQKAKRKPLAVAKKLLAEAGYPGGRNPKTGKQLILNYDVTATSSPDDKARFNWMRKQFAKLGIQLNIRSTQYNRFQDKVRTGHAQIFSWGWLADYPDPENFLFLLYGPNGKVKHGGENASNYVNPTVDRLFEQIKILPDGKQRQQKINALLKIIREDSPWIWGVHPIQFTLSHSWNHPSKPHAIANNLLKYQRLDFEKRQALQKKWNKPVLWPLWGLLAFLIIIALPLALSYWRRERRPRARKY
ncbi:MAG: ABC transporter substrate-binding protein [Gammaproteobacteria bacterium]|nr:ABC transporter substrate-binding protein [Gammaproteobacteria bacterium]MCH9745085.1 ABC transporter substrate-binding protein [Gammaproteobacteria bacterium]